MAAPREAEAARAALGLDAADAQSGWFIERSTGPIDLIETGVGKAQAAGATAFACTRERYAGVLSIGVGGVLPASELAKRLEFGSAVLATRSVFADEGGQTPDGFVPIEAMGFPASRSGTAGSPCDPAWQRILEPLIDTTAVIATVSTCSGTDALAAEIARRTGASVEAMEGAAVAAALEALPGDHRPVFAEVRLISNTTGDRASQRWDLDKALHAMRSVLERLRDHPPRFAEPAG